MEVVIGSTQSGPIKRKKGSRCDERDKNHPKLTTEFSLLLHINKLMRTTTKKLLFGREGSKKIRWNISCTLVQQEKHCTGYYINIRNMICQIVAEH